MLLMDGVKYELWTPSTENEFEQIVKEHAQDVFGEQSIYFDRKQKLKSLSGVGSIPDGYAIVFGDKHEWHIVEVELSSHPLYNHIVPQISRFISGINNPSTRKTIIEAMYHALISDDLNYFKMNEVIQTGEYYKFISDIVSNSPVITVIIEKDTPELHDALESLNHPKINIVEFQTFTREGVGLPVHAHLFEPLYKCVITPEPKIHSAMLPIPHPTKSEKARKVTFQELISEGLLKDGEVLYFYNTRLFSDERAQVIASENKLRCQADGNLYSKTKLAERLFRKYDFKYVALRGPQYWKTEDGRSLVELEEQVRSLRGDRG